MRDIHEILKTVWGYEQFRPLQEDIIQSILQQKDTLALLPTGGGKSLCFQIPALAMDGLCLVISPLIALMKDQVENLRKKGITAFAIHSGLNYREVESVLKAAGNSNCKFLYVSPERLETRLFQEYLPSLGVGLIAVDEAHCISQWGYDFRPSYLSIGKLRDELPGIPLLALTASATAMVQEDICLRLGMENHAIFRQSFERPNLSYSVFPCDSKINRILEIIGKVNGTALIYCRSRKRTKEFSDLLNMHGISTDFYHAGLSQEERNRKQEDWIHNRVRIIVCTNAFGMGIDKPDVRLVIHADVPECLENYYQEAGRAGRDLKKSYAVLLYSEKDIAELKERTKERFPDISVIRQVYRSLVNFLQLPAFEGEGMTLDFDLNAFLGFSGHESSAAIAALKTLEQEGLFSINEQVFVPSKIQFTCNRNSLSEFLQLNPALDPVIKCLLRTYEGILDQLVYVSEKKIAYQLMIETDDLIQHLRQLHAAGILEYLPQKENPCIYFMVNRPPVEQLHIDQSNYSKRKASFAERIDSMIHFVREKKTCRAKEIGGYFGDEKIRDCLICDNCLDKKRMAITGKEIEEVNRKIVEHSKSGAQSVQILLDRLKPMKKDRLMQILEFLQQEGKVSVTRQGEITTK